MNVFLLLVITAILYLSGKVSSLFVKSNEIITVELNGYAPPYIDPYPCITSVTIQNNYQIVPPIAVGALFQMTTRSYQGDKYNPTQSGACLGSGSQLNFIRDNYNALDDQIPGNGILLGVQPRTFLSYEFECTNGELSPYLFTFGITLGDGIIFPKVVTLLKQSFQKLSENVQEIVYRGSELPTVYFTCEFAKYAFYINQRIDPLEDATIVWLPWGTETNQVQEWPPLGPGSMLGYGNMRCNGPDPQIALCAVLYYGGTDLMELGGNNQKSGGCAMNLVNHKLGFINDTLVYSRSVLFVVGNADTVTAAIKQTIPIVDNQWGNF